VRAIEVNDVLRAFSEGQRASKDSPGASADDQVKALSNVEVRGI
jgi:hypothetical protein